MSEQASIRGRFCVPGFPGAVAETIRGFAAQGRVQFGDHAPGVAALESAANYAQGLGLEDAVLASLFSLSAGESGRYEPGDAERSVLAVTAGMYAGVPAPATVLVELAVAALEQQVADARAEASEARATLSAAQAEAEHARAAVAEAEPLRDRVAELEAKNAEGVAELERAHEQVAFLRAGYDEWARQTQAAAKPKPATRKPVAA